MNGVDYIPVHTIPLSPKGISQRTVPRPGNRSNARVMAVPVIGERGKAAPARVPFSVEQGQAQLAAMIADRRARGVRPEGIRFEGEEDL